MFTLTDVAAWVGAAAGIGALIWQLATWRKSAHNVKVTRMQAWFGLSDGSLSEEMLCVTARNVGSAPVTVTNWGVRVPDGGSLAMFSHEARSTPLPHRLEPGSDMDLWMPASEFARFAQLANISSKQMRAWVGLATGKRIYAKRGLPVNVTPEKPDDSPDGRS